jgi:hypothetical protein
LLIKLIRSHKLLLWTPGTPAYLIQESEIFSLTLFFRFILFFPTKMPTRYFPLRRKGHFMSFFPERILLEGIL